MIPKLAAFLSAALTAAAAASAQQPAPVQIAAPHPQARAAAEAMLDQGGSAADAAIAAQLVLNVVAPQSTGIGGSGVMLYYEAATGGLRVFNGLARAPQSAQADQFLAADGTPLDLSEPGVRAALVAAPGLLELLGEARRKAGTLRWKTLVGPAQALAEYGFAVTAELADAIARHKETLRASDQARALFLPDGQPAAAGAQIHNAALAAFLRRIGESGSYALSTGKTPDRIEAALKARSPDGLPLISAADIRGYYTRPIGTTCTRFTGQKLCVPDLPVAGGLYTLQTLALLSHFPLERLDFAAPETAHLLIEAMRLADADRALFFADPVAEAVPLPGLLTPRYITARAQRIRHDQAMTTAPPGNPPWFLQPGAERAPQSPLPPGTASITVADSDGNVAALVSTLHGDFGSGIMVHGFFLNRAMTAFSPHAEKHGRHVANAIAPNRRAMIANAPLMALNPGGGPSMILGATGGMAGQQRLIQTFLALRYFCSSLADVESTVPRFATARDDVVLPTESRGGSLHERLTDLGHRIRFRDGRAAVSGIIRGTAAFQKRALPPISAGEDKEN